MVCLSRVVYARLYKLEEPYEAPKNNKNNRRGRRRIASYQDIRRPFHTSLNVRMPYYEKGFSIGGGLVGTCNVQLFNLGSIFDPDTTGVGHQALGYDQFVQMYEQYVVLAVKYRVTLVNASSTNSALVGVTISDSPTTQTDSRLYVENGITRWETLGVTGGNRGVVSISGRCELNKIHGLTEMEHIAAHITGFGGNPTESAFLHVWACDSLGGTAPGIYLTAELEYHVVLKGYTFTPLS